jgi:YVTN family beta-propeller protein
MRMEFDGRKRLLLLLVPLLVAGTILACDLGGLRRGGAVPNVVINAPPNNSEVRLGETIPIRSTATDATGVTRIELWVDGALYVSETSPIAQGQSPFSVAQDWAPQVLGSHKIVVRAYNAAGNMGEPSSITLVVVSGPPELTPTQTPPQPTQTPPPPTHTPPPPSPTATQPHPPPTGTPLPTHTPTSGACLPSVVDTIGLVGHPKGVVAHGHRVYVGLHDVPKVAVIEADTNTVLTDWDTGVSGHARYANGVAFHLGSGRLYVANRDDNSISSIDINAPSNVNVIPVGTQPFGIAVAGQYVYVANFGDNRIGRIDTSADNYFSLTMIFNQPALLASLGQHVFVPTNGPGPIYRIPPTGSPIAVGIPAKGYFAAAANANQRVFVTNRKTDEVTKINGNTNSVQGAPVSLPHAPYGIAVNLSKNRVYVVAAEADLLYVLDGATLQIVGTVPVGAQGPLEGGQGIAVLGNRIYVSNYQDGSLTVLDDSACP